MWGRRIAYLATLGICFLLYLLFREWFFWLLLVFVAGLPLLSLLLSLPAMLTVKVALTCPNRVRVGVPIRTSLKIFCPFPAPPVRFQIRLKNLLSEESYVGYPGEYVPVSHCGVIDITYKKIWVWDYLGLFRRGFSQDTPCRVVVEPKPIPGLLPEQNGDSGENGWKPKPGGYAENHELRLYRPGDDLRLLHHKMSAKIGKMVYREPVVPMLDRLCLVMTLSGTPAELDGKLGRLAWIGQELVAQGRSYQLFCQTGEGLQTLQITDRAGQEQAMQTLLGCRPTKGEWIPENIAGYHRIGGGL